MEDTAPVSRGVTLLELLVVLAILGLILGGSYALYAPTYRLGAASAELRALLQAARTEAIRRGTLTTVRLGGEELSLEVQNQVLGRFSPTPYGARLTGPANLVLNALGRPVEERVSSYTLSLGNRKRTLCVEVGGRVREVTGDGC